jgi:hypothetical protein
VSGLVRADAIVTSVREPVPESASLFE